MSATIEVEHRSRPAYVYVRHNSAKEIMAEHSLVMQQKCLFVSTAVSCGGTLTRHYSGRVTIE